VIKEKKLVSSTPKNLYSNVQPKIVFKRYPKKEYPELPEIDKLKLDVRYMDLT